VEVVQGPAAARRPLVHGWPLLLHKPPLLLHKPPLLRLLAQ
jgi:hypothetical protein